MKTKNRGVLAWGCVFIVAVVLCGVAYAKPIPIREDPILGYVDHSNQAVRVLVAVGGVGGALSRRGAWDVYRPDEIEKLRPHFQVALARAAERPALVAALRSHWIKVSQCLTVGSGEFDVTRAELARCQSELAERAALVELESR